MADSLNVLSAYRFSAESQALLSQAANAPIVCVSRPEEFMSRLPEAEVLCAFDVPDDIYRIAPRLRWLQFPGAGIDGLHSTGLLDAGSPIIVTTATGIHAVPISEYVFCSMLMFNRSWPEMVRLQDNHTWPRTPGWYNLGGRELEDQTLGIIGLGHIGRRIAQLAHSFGMRVLATRRSITTQTREPDVDQLYDMAHTHDVLRQSDYVVVAVPLTQETEHFIGEAELRAMQPHAYLVNIARGLVIDEQALVRALQERWIAGAGLDVTEEEPLPASSPLYSMKNVILTPHISGVSVGYDRRLASLFADNLQRYRAGKSLRNLYDPERGY